MTLSHLPLADSRLHGDRIMEEMSAQQLPRFKVDPKGPSLKPESIRTSEKYGFDLPASIAFQEGFRRAGLFQDQWKKQTYAVIKAKRELLQGKFPSLFGQMHGPYFEEGLKKNGNGNLKTFKRNTPSFNVLI